MNEEELKKGCGKEIEENDKEVITCGNSLSYNGKLPTGKWKKFKFRLCPTCQAKLEYFQKGKLEQKKEELEFLKERCIYCMIADDRIKQLQKEIGEEKQDENS